MTTPSLIRPAAAAGRAVRGCGARRGQRLARPRDGSHGVCDNNIALHLRSAFCIARSTHAKHTHEAHTRSTHGRASHRSSRSAAAGPGQRLAMRNSSSGFAAYFIPISAYLAAPRAVKRPKKRARTACMRMAYACSRVRHARTYGLHAPQQLVGSWRLRLCALAAGAWRTCPAASHRPSPGRSRSRRLRTAAAARDRSPAHAKPRREGGGPLQAG